MREILFRGKRKDDDCWEVGDYSTYKASDGICRSFINGFEYEVYPETVGQYTGIKDCEGVKIFEGDIVEYWYRSLSGTVSSTAIVKFYDGAFQLEDIDDSDSTELLYLAEDLEVIGNVWDNPELLEFNDDDDDDELWEDDDE